MSKNVDPLSFLSGSNANFLDQLYDQYKADPASVDDKWRTIFEKTDQGDFSIQVSIPSSVRPNSQNFNADHQAASPQNIDQSLALVSLINNFRNHGHTQANIDPLELQAAKPLDILDPSFHGLNINDVQQIYLPQNYYTKTHNSSLSVSDFIDELRKIYCQKIGFEYMHVDCPIERQWLQDKIESAKPSSIEPHAQIRIYDYLMRAEEFERFLHKKYPGAKRFGIEGGESLIPTLDIILEKSAQAGVSEAVFGMAHRGRLSVLATIFEMPLRKLFAQFQGAMALPDAVEGSGDVKYHLGLSTNRNYGPHTMHLSLTANPSHLEAVNPVVLGKVRAKQDMLGDDARNKVMGILIHGDAAFAGQGIVTESLQMAYLKGYSTGGTLHIIINNQIGFTTNPDHSRSTRYSSDVAKMIGAPIFHVNGDDPDAVAHVAQLAAQYRMEFKKDVVIDLICYRRLGHNESDEPNFTQPIMYQKIANHPSTRTQYEEKLTSNQIISDQQRNDLVANWIGYLETEFEAANNLAFDKVDWLEGAWQGISAPKNFESLYKEHVHPHFMPTGIARSTLELVGNKIFDIPKDFDLNSKIERQFIAKKAIFENNTEASLDWATAEALAFGTLLLEGVPIRFTGQDVQRGTFSHRHAVLTDQTTQNQYCPLEQLKDLSNNLPKFPKIEIVNSLLSEAAVVGFEYGYSAATPNNLVIWEAQFGDFVNGAQIIIDQFISSSESKWQRLSGLVMLLPHGFEGQGPEHSSARMERFLQLCAQSNLQVVNCSTPANYFHALRRQIKSDTRKPLIVFSPKSLLRHKMAVSNLSEMDENTQFQPVLAQVNPDPTNVKKVVICTGKIYYDLLKMQQENDVAKEQVLILRAEQLYPFPQAALAQHMKDFSQAKVIWCQEEPKNMGAWSFIEPNLAQLMSDLNYEQSRPMYVGRAPSASPATGFLNRHNMEQDDVCKQALSLD